MSLATLKINAIDCYGLNKEDQKRIEEIGLWRWMDEVENQKVGRGVKICDRWDPRKVGTKLAFTYFVRDMGPRPGGKARNGRALYSIHRVDNYPEYGPGYCVWATHKEQCANDSDVRGRRGSNDRTRYRCVTYDSEPRKLPQHYSRFLRSTGGDRR